MCVSYIVTLYTTIMVGTPPYQKRGKCGHWMPAFDKHMRCYGCRMHCKGEDPCASGAPLEACSSCSSLSEVEWNHLRTVFQERSAKRASKNIPADPEPDEEDPEAGEIDDSILDLNPEDSGTGYVSPTGVSAPAGLSPLQPEKRGKCGHWMPAFDKHMRCYGCRMHCKGEDPCASGAPLEACSSCSSLSEVE